ncbi:WLM-domain-containing protein [Pluteus cervinus]|uniref:WLM-domain-containing protein n=1 Tax=Pluteus cervinus TaxID=181527 RepID=A0ACD3B4S7_9AGAR|nr:WLM-domain-containing protein [Pluteus cervinus]
MVHVRTNEKEANPNSHVNFITVLPCANAQNQEDARQYLRALAAQVRPVMKAHGFTVNSLEEYEHNMVFSGRNWNAGETVELVLRREDGSFLPPSWLMSTLCHELAHIKHMNHGPAFQALWKRLNTEVQALQAKGYYGDGYWSSGNRLRDSARVAGDGIQVGELPEYICGGAHTSSRPTARRRREGAGTSATGRQTAKKRKPGSRVLSKTAFVGKGASLNEGDSSNGKGTGFGKRANSKRAREERAMAIEKRLRGLKADTKPPPPGVREEVSDDDSSDGEVEIVAETDVDRRRTLKSSGGDKDMEGLKSSDLWKVYQHEFKFTAPPANRDDDRVDCDVIELTDDEDEALAGPSSRPLQPSTKPPPPQQHRPSNSLRAPRAPSKDSKQKSNPSQRSRGRSEQTTFKTENRAGASINTEEKTTVEPKIKKGFFRRQKEETKTDMQWSCQICTLLNEPKHLACSVCGSPRGEETWNR